MSTYVQSAQQKASAAYAYLIAAVAALSGLLFGFDIAVINGAIVFLREQFSLSDVQTEVAAGALLLGCAFGAAVAGMLSDRFGRKRILIFSAILFAVSSIAAGLPRGMNEFIAARLLGGVAVGVASMLAPLYIAENSPPRIRGRLVAFNQMAIVTGILLAYLVNWLLSGIGPNAWRWMFAFAAIPAVLFWIAMMFVPESPRWLIKQERHGEAMRVLTRLAGPQEAKAEFEEIRNTVAEEENSVLVLLHAGFRRPLIIAVALAILQQITGVNTVLYYGALIFREQVGEQSRTAAIGVNVIVGAINFLATILAIWIIDKVGRKPLLLASSGGMAVSLLVLGLAFRLDPAPASLVLAVILCYVFSFAIGMGPGVWVLMSELFPTRIRGRAMAIATVSLWLACLLLTSTFLSLVSAIQASGTFWLYSAICLFTFLFIWLVTPETKGKTLEQIERMWKRGLVLLLVAALAPLRGAESARLHVEIRERSANRTIPARVYLVDRQGTLHAPEGAIVYRRHQEHHFISSGSFDVALPAGEYSLAVERGLEYHPWAAELSLSEGETKRIDVTLQRWMRMNERLWFSGDLHNHRKPEEMSQLIVAEDLNVAPTLTDWIWEERPNSRPPATTEAIRRVDGTHVFSVLDKEVERLKHGPGAVDLLALRTPIPFEGDWLYPPNDVFCRLAHAQGGYVDAEKIMWRDVPALVALGHIDFAGIVHNHFNRHGVELETDEWGMAPKDRPELNTPRGMALWTTELYYRFLNCGFRLPVSAGSASGVKASPLGYCRVYAHLDRPFSYENWFRALKEGRSFATNGPVLFLTVNGKLPGSTLELPEGKAGRLQIKAEARSARPLESLEILFKGRVVKKAEASASGRTAQVELDLPVEDTGWVAARVFEQPDKTIRYAQTSPVYVQVSGKPGVVAEDARYFAAWMRREKEFYKKEQRFRSPAHREAMVELFTKAEAVYERLAAEASRRAK